MDPGVKEAFETLAREVLDLTVQCKFWRQAAEHAVTGWNQLEDKYEGTVDIVRNLFEGNKEESARARQQLELCLDEHDLEEGPQTETQGTRK